MSNTTPGARAWKTKRSEHVNHPNELATEGIGERTNIFWTLAATPVPCLVLCMECDASKSLLAVKSGGDVFPRDRPPHAGVGYLVAPNYTKSSG